MDQNNVPIQPFQYPLLTSLDENGPMDIGSLANTLGVSQPGVTRSVSQLMEQGFVIQAKDEQDKRKRIIALSDTGRKIVEHGRSDIWPQIEACLNEIVSNEPAGFLEHLNDLEEGLRSASFKQRVEAQKKGQSGE
jgi:DNA-binding MarR family transcriptional regulator